MADIVYPLGCRPLTEDLGTDELIRRLKTLAHRMQEMRQDEGLHPQYIPLALHLVDDYFLQNNSRDVQLLVACCVADVLRVYAPEAPYKDQEQIKTIFLFFIKQLYGLKDPKDPSFKRYFYLLENLAYVKSFNMCFEIEDCQTIFCQLFGMMFKIINEEHSSKVKNFMIDILRPLITEADNFTTDLLDLILINIVDPHKSQNKHAYQLAEQLIIKTADSLEPVIKLFFDQVLLMDKVDKNIAISAKIYEVIYELNVICPSILCSVLPQLECKLKATNESERLKAVSLLARMFSEKDSQLSKKHPTLLRVLFGRFCDIAVAIRVKCVQSSMHFLLNQPHLRQDIIESLRARQHDSDENVRYEVVMAIVETAKRQFEIVCESEDLLDFVRERTLDKKFKIRKEAMNGLAYIYKQAVCEPNQLSENIKRSVDWIKNKVLHGYYMPGMEDRLLVERLLITCLVPYKLAPEERMKKLYHLLGTLDDNATRAFVELQKNQMKIRKTVSDWVKLHHSKEVTPKLQNQLAVKQAIISKLLPDPLKASEYLTKFSNHLHKDPMLLRYMDIILKRDVSCKECADTMSMLLKKLGTPIMTNLYYNTVKMLIERIASVMVDKESIGILIGLIEKCMERGSMIKEVGIPREEAGERGLKLLCLLSYIFSAHFFTDTTLRHMIALLSYDEEYAAPLILKSLAHLGRYNPLCDVNPVIFDELAQICKDFALSGTVKQAKQAVRCVFVNSQTLATTTTATAPNVLVGAEIDGNANNGNNTQPIIHKIFTEIIETLRTSWSGESEHLHTHIVTLGHIAYHMPQAFFNPIKNMIARRLVKELLITKLPETRDVDTPIGDWCAEYELPHDTLCKVDALKTIGRWLLGLRTDEHAAYKTFRMLCAFINQRGDLLEQNRLSAAEKAWLRLSAACATLRICEQKGVGDQYSAEQYFSLSQMMFDPVLEVRETFTRKLHKGLGKGLPNRCLPLDFMGFYALAGHETNKKLSETIRHFVEADVNRRREYLKTVGNSSNSILTSSDNLTEQQTLYILPDFMLAFAIPVLAHDPAFTNYEDRQQLRKVENCLRFVLEPLMAKRESFSYGFYTKLIEKMKQHQDVTPDVTDNTYNHKMWAACDLAMYVINSKIGQIGDIKSNDAFSVQIQLPAMYYKPLDMINTKIYIPSDMYSIGGGAGGAGAPNANASSTTSATTTTTTENANASMLSLKRNRNGALMSTTTTATTTTTTKSLTLRTNEKRESHTDIDDLNENEPSNSHELSTTTTSTATATTKSKKDPSEPMAKRTRSAALHTGKS